MCSPWLLVSCCLLTENSLHLLNNNFRHEKNEPKAEKNRRNEASERSEGSTGEIHPNQDEGRATNISSSSSCSGWYKKRLPTKYNRSRVSNVERKTTRLSPRTKPETKVETAKYHAYATLDHVEKIQVKWSYREKNKTETKSRQREKSLPPWLVSEFLLQAFGQFTSGSA